MKFGKDSQKVWADAPQIMDQIWPLSHLHFHLLYIHAFYYAEHFLWAEISQMYTESFVMIIEY